jgi:hypothetical protein
MPRRIVWTAQAKADIRGVEKILPRARSQGGVPLVGYEAKKTEHSGPKRGNGAYWGYKCEAKKESNRIRRENWKREIRDNTIGVMPEEAKDQPCASSASAIAPGLQVTPPGDA